MSQMKISRSRSFSLVALFAVSLTVAVTLGACGKTTNGEGSYWVQGVISDSLTKLPIDGAWVAANDTLHTTKYYSNSQGHYIMQVAVNSGSIFAGKGGYRTKEVRLGTVTSDRTGVNIELAPMQSAIETTRGPKGD